jgi:hypothetical protein
MALSGYYPGFPNDIVLDHGALAIGDTILATSRGGSRFTPGTQYRRPPYDGERTEVEGMRRIVGWESMFSGTWYFIPNRVLDAIENGLTITTPGGNITTLFTPEDCNRMFLSTQYLLNTRIIGSRTQDTGDVEYFQVRFPMAVIDGDWSIVTLDKDEWMLEGAQFKAVLPSAVAATNPNECPYVYEVLVAHGIIPES